MTQVLAPTDVFAALMRERPKLHGAHDGSTLARPGVYDWSLDPAVLQWLMRRVRPGLRTLETGCGYSTIVFALGQCRHQVISPFPEEHESIREWCEQHGVSTDTVVYHLDTSQRLLPVLEPTPLDLAIIDGDHAVPTPLIDYYYLADRLERGGLLLVDDTQLRSVRQLTDFLDTETPRWVVAEQIARTRIYRKVVRGKVTNVVWRQQPFAAAAAEVPPKPKRSLLYRGLRKIKRTLLG